LASERFYPSYEGDDNFLGTVPASSGKAQALEKLLKTLIGTITVKNRVDGEISHPDSVIVIGGLQPLECVLFLVPAVPTIVLQYSSFKQITDDISDARVYGGKHFRTDQEAGADLGRAVGRAVYKNNLRPLHDDE